VDLRLDNQVALVTGAATGIGRATALALAASGARVAVNHLGKPDEAQEVVAEIRQAGGEAVAIEADVSNEAQVQRLIEDCMAQLGGLDVLVNNAGIILEKPFLSMTVADWDRIIDTDLKSVFLCARAVLPNMLEKGSGCIVNIASELGFIGRAEYTAYTTAKAGVMTLTRSLAREFAPVIRINAVAPGPTATPMLEPGDMSQEMIDEESNIPAQRVGEPEEIAAAVVFLASEQASFFHGQVISPNGGAYMA
jgi:3-oxoacyl-[acyl-carrier protein] reductase